MAHADQTAGVYKFTNTRTGKVYVGSSQCIVRRKYLHEWSLTRGDHHSVLFQRSWDKYGKNSFVFETVLVCEVKDLLMYEQIVLDHLNAADPQYGLNISKIVGAGGSGVEWTAERRAAHSAQRLGKSIFLNNPEAHARLMASKLRGENHPMWGKSHSPEIREKIKANRRPAPAWNKGIPSENKGVAREESVRIAIRDSKRKASVTGMTVEIAKNIREQHAAGKKILDIIADTGFGRSLIYRIIANTAWKE